MDRPSRLQGEVTATVGLRFGRELKVQRASTTGALRCASTAALCTHKSTHAWRTLHACVCAHVHWLIDCTAAATSTARARLVGLPSLQAGRALASMICAAVTWVLPTTSG